MYNQQEEINKEKLIKDEQFLDDATAFLIDSVATTQKT